MYGRKKKEKPLRRMKGSEVSPCGAPCPIQHKVQEAVEVHKKVKPVEVFGKGYDQKTTPKVKSSTEVKKTKKTKKTK